MCGHRMTRPASATIIPFPARGYRIAPDCQPQHRVLLMKLRIVASLLLALAASTASAAEPIQIAIIDTLSGPFAREGRAIVQHHRYMAALINREGGVLGRPLEILALDNKGSPQESLVLLRHVADQGIQYIAQGNGSHVAGALVEALDRHNRRHPDQQILFLNYSAVDPTLTNEHCSFWHFRFDTGADMRLDALTSFMARQEKVRRVFLLNQDYTHGHQVRDITRRMLAEKAPHIEIVGDVLHPIGKVKDFAPYIARIRAAGADAVLTGNWGNDLALLVRAGKEAGLDVDYYTFYAGGFGVPIAMGSAGESRVFQVTEWRPDLPDELDLPEMAAFAQRFAEATGGETPWYFHRVGTQMRMLARAMRQAGSTEPAQVAKALEGMRQDTAFGPAVMRQQDHQLLQPLFISVFTERARHKVEGSGLGFVTVARIPAEQTAQPSSCAMERP